MSKLLVIGNGFDRKIGAKTSYEEFFDSDYYINTKDKAYEWIESVKFYDSDIFKAVNCKDYDFTCWDLLFCVIKKSDESVLKQARWCDIEKVIHDSLVGGLKGNFLWDNIFLLLQSFNNDKLSDPMFGRDMQLYRLSDLDIKTKAIFYFISGNRSKDCILNKELFYEMLLNELVNFEKSFGLYINLQTNTEDFSFKAKSLARRLMKESGGRLLIDSFNYSTFYSTDFDIRHINGDTNNPIFGIELSPNEEKMNYEISCFTKTSRRVQQDSFKFNRDSSWGLSMISKAVVFGHSLNEMDYDYFNYLFTMLKFYTLKPSEMGEIEFVFSIYDEGKKNKIRNDFSNSIYTLLNYYEDSINGINQHILINMLRFSGKLKIREI